MENNHTDDTLKEILEEDSAVVRRKNKRKKGCFVRFLLILTLLFVFFYGLIYVVQFLTDLEAEARVRAILTVSAMPGNETIMSEQSQLEITQPSAEETVAPAPTETSLPSTATLDADLARTATIAAQLTSVADFQETVTP
jgi:hypothetical protein